MSTQTIYEYAGGAAAFQRLLERFYAKVREDALLAPLFAGFTDAHVRRVAVWLGEVFGGPPVYSEQLGGHHGLLLRHGGLGISEAQRARWAELLVATAREELPPEPKLQRRFAAYIEWGTRVAREASQPGYGVPPGGPPPRWDWGPEGPPGPSAPAR
jgi:hemoglobin